MRIKSLVLLSSLGLLFACGGGSTTSETSSSQPTSQISQEEAFTLFTNAITFKTNDRFTGYRLNVYIRNIETKEQVYSLYRNVSMDKTNNACEYTETVTRINDDINSFGVILSITNLIVLKVTSNRNHKGIINCKINANISNCARNEIFLERKASQKYSKYLLIEPSSHLLRCLNNGNR